MQKKRIFASFNVLKNTENAQIPPTINTIWKLDSDDKLNCWEYMYCPNNCAKVATPKIINNGHTTSVNQNQIRLMPFIINTKNPFP